MGFFALLKALDELVYEVMSWLVFYPITLWQSIRHPLSMMAYAQSEFDDSDRNRYAEAISPPLFLLISLLISHGIELATVGQSSLVRSNVGLAALIKDDTSLILVRLLLFSAFPMIMAVLLVRAQRRQVTRSTLQKPFYSQCYLTSPFALALGIGTILQQRAEWLHWTGVALVLGALVFLIAVEARWFAMLVPSSILKGLGWALLGLLIGLTVIAAVGTALL